MINFDAMPIRRLMILLLIFLSSVSLCLICYSSLSQREYRLHEAVERLSNTVDRIENEQNLIMAGMEQLALTLTQLPETHSRSSDSINRLLESILVKNPAYSNIALIDSSGRLWASAVAADTGLSFSDRRYFVNALSTGRMSSGECTISRILRVPVLSFGYPVTDHSGRITDVLVITLNLRNYKKLSAVHGLPGDLTTTLVDHRGIILYSSYDETLVGTGDQQDYFRQMKEGPANGSFETVATSGSRDIAAYAKVGLKHEAAPYMYIRTSTNKNAFLGSVNREFITGIAVLSCAVALSALLVLMSLNTLIFRKISAIRGATNRIADGDFTVRLGERVSGGELGDLAASFDSMAQTLASNARKLADANEKQNKSEQRLLKSEQRFRSFVENANDVLFALTPSGEFSYVSPQWTKAYGYDLSETIGRSFVPFVHPDDVAACHAFMEKVIAQGGNHSGIEYRVIRKDGTAVWYKANASLIIDPVNGSPVLLGIGRDISERKQAEETLQLSEKKFSAAFKSSPDALALTAMSSGMYLDVNDGFSIITGYTLEETLGRSTNDLNIWHDSNDRAKLLDGISLHGSVKEMEAKLQRKDGTVFTGSITACVIQVKDEPCILSITRDITDREQIQQEIIKAQKLESISILAGGIAHNFNNVLTGVIGYISYAKKQLDNNDKLISILDAAEKSSHRAAGLARQLLTFSRTGNPVKSIQAVYGLIEESVLLFLSGTKVTGNISIPPHLHINVDSQQMNQAFNNIVLNALQAMPDGGILSVAAEEVELTAGNKYALAPGTYVRIIFGDTGHGIAPENIARVFDPYFTTKDNGTGLGLSSTHAVIKSHGGGIDIISNPGEGAKVTVLLPAAASVQQI